MVYIFLCAKLHPHKQPIQAIIFFISIGVSQNQNFYLHESHEYKWTFSEANSKFINIATDLNIVNTYLSSSLNEKENIEKAREGLLSSRKIRGGRDM